MQFNIGPIIYNLVISDRAIFDNDGNELEGLAVEHRRLLIVSFRVEPDRREEVALHELAHAYEFHFGTPDSQEGRCQMFATAAKGFRMDLDRQGGAEALLQLVPRRVSHLGRPAVSRTPVPPPDAFGPSDRIPCGCCGSDIMCGSIRNAEPEPHQTTGQVRMRRWAECDGCGVLMVWQEVCTADGTPLGQFVANPPPRMLRGADASAWLAENGRAETHH